MDEAANGTNPRLYGSLEDGVYTAPGKTFQIKIPVLEELGGDIADTPNTVTFDDNSDVHINIGVFPLTPQLKAELDSRGIKNFLIYYFSTFILPDYGKAFPGARLEEDAFFTTKCQNGAIFLYLLLPGGSHFEQQTRFTPNIPIPPVVGKRGNVCFIRSGSVFIVSVELADRAIQRSTYNRPAAEENVILRKRLTDLLDKMSFPAPENRH